jgi:putative DNA primase/helicase
MAESLTEEEKKEILSRKKQDTAPVPAPIDYLTLLTVFEGLQPDEKLKNYLEIKPVLMQLKSTLEREVAIKRVAKALGVSTAIIKEELAGGTETAATRRPRWVDHSGDFVPPILAQFLMNKQCTFVYDRNMLYFFDEGYYKPKGFQYIKGRCVELMGDEYRDGHGNEVGKYIETTLWHSEPVLDVDARYINVENGLLDWMADPPELKPHDPNYLSSIRIPVHYDPDATCPAIDQFFADILPEDCLELAYELFGYCLIPDTNFQKAFMMLGDGANGKSKFLALLQAFIGRANCSAESLQDLAENRFRAANLVGKLVNIFSDLPAKMLEDTALFKALVSGDALSAERKGEQAFEFINYARMVFSANKLPPTKDLSHGFFRRWCIIRFPNSFPEGSPKRDPAILSKITTQQELSGLLNQAIVGLVRLFSQREFSKPASVEAEVAIYQNENDNVRLFFADCCEFKIGAIIGKDQLYKSYEKWCHSGNYRAISRTKFNNHVKSVFPSVREDTHGVRKWVGIAELMLDKNDTGDTA